MKAFVDVSRFAALVALLVPIAACGGGDSRADAEDGGWRALR